MRTKYLCVLIIIRNKGKVGTVNPIIFLLTVPMRCFFCGSFLLSVFRVCLTVLFVPCSIVFICWERAALLCVMLSCVFVTFLHGVPGQVWYLIELIPDPYLLYCLFCRPV